MAEKKHIQDLDELLVLSMLTRVSMTHSQIREELIKLTDGAIPYSVNNVSGILFKLRSERLVDQCIMSAKKTEYAASASGREELRKRLELYRTYDRLLHQPVETVSLPKLTFVRPGDYERSFNRLVEGAEFEEAQGVILSLTRSAFKAGWTAAVGEAPSR